MVFYDPDAGRNPSVLPEEESQHCIRVLRHRNGDPIRVIDGKGHRFEAVIEEDHPRRCRYRIDSTVRVPPDPYHVHLAIAPTKNSERMEWMVEKCVEIGVHEITFIHCSHSERSRLRLDRLEKKAVAAMKQSGRAYSTRINELEPFTEFLTNCPGDTLRHIAWVPASGTAPHLKDTARNGHYIVLVGPEGDFSDEEISQATVHGFEPTSLGHSILRTETAGIAVCHTLALLHI